MLDSDPNEPDGVTAGSVQGQWLQAGLAAATEPFKIVAFHHSDYTSGSHGGEAWMQWPFAQWGASAVLTGHNHIYERLLVNGIPDMVNGIGGQNITGFGSIDPRSQFRWNDDFGAMRINVTQTAMKFQFYAVSGELVDYYTVDTLSPRPNVSIVATDPNAAENPNDGGMFTLSRSGSTSSARWW